MKNLMFLTFVLLILAGCYTSPTAIILYQPTLALNTEDLHQFVIDPQDDGIWGWDDTDTVDFEIVITETEGIDAYITELNWRVKDYEQVTRENGLKVLTAPFLIKGNKEDTLTISVIINGHDADHIDDADGTNDNVALGIIEISCDFYDKNGVTYSSRSIVKEIKIVQP